MSVLKLQTCVETMQRVTMQRGPTVASVTMDMFPVTEKRALIVQKSPVKTETNVRMTRKYADLMHIVLTQMEVIDVSATLDLD